MLNKEQLIRELKDLHKDLVYVYQNIFTYKWKNDNNFKDLIELEYEKDSIKGTKEQKKWNEQYYHRAAYTLLNKVLFIRICEDKGFMLNNEDKIMNEELNPNIGKKLSLIGLQKWTNLISNFTFSELIKFAFKDMNHSYRNISLYKEDKYDWLIPSKSEMDYKFNDANIYLKMPYSQFEEIIKKMIETLDVSQYNFAESSDNVLGDVYEKFMDRETRKELGQFYTPDFVINYILKNTVERIDVTENPFVKVLDPSCGSGHFLIMAYDILRKKFEENLENIKEKYSEQKYKIIINNEMVILEGKEYWTEKYLHYHLLKNCIYGSDIDPFALQITTINLLLKDLNNFITDDLNIIECDSLLQLEKDYDFKEISRQIYQEQSLFIELNYIDLKGRRIKKEIGVEEAEGILKKCLFWDNEFDYIIGNPPYGSKLKEELKQYYKMKYSDVHMRTIDIYNFFIQRFIQKSSRGYGFIIPDSILTQYEFSKTREYLIKNSEINQIIKMGEGVFEDNAYPTAIILGSKNTINSKNEVTLIDVSKVQDTNKKAEALIQPVNKYSILQKNINKMDQSRFLFIENQMIDLLLSIKGTHETLQKYTMNIARGITTGKDKAYLMNIKDIESLNIPSEVIKPVLVGGDINPYKISFKNKYIPYITRDFPALSKEDCNRLLIYLDRFNEISQIDENTTLQDFQLHRPREEGMFLEDKLICRQTGDKLVCAIDKSSFYNLDSVINLVLNEEGKDKLSIEFITALLNSKLCNVYYSLLVQEGDRAFAQVKPIVLQEIPIPKVSKDTVEAINNLVNEIIKLNESNDKEELKLDNSSNLVEEYMNEEDAMLANRIKAYYLEEEINEIFYGIFNLTKEQCKQIDSKYALFFEKEVEVINNDSKLTINHFEEEINMKKKDMFELAKEYNITLENIFELRLKYRNALGEEGWKLYDLSRMYSYLGNYLLEQIIVILIREKTFLDLKSIIGYLEGIIRSELDEIITLFKLNSPSKNKETILKEIINHNSITFNKYLKEKTSYLQVEKVIKYDTNIYGLTNWSDEIHKKYFVDSVTYHSSSQENIFTGTVFETIRKSETKGKTALNILKLLEFQDKKDYIEILSGKMGLV